MWSIESPYSEQTRTWLGGAFSLFHIMWSAEDRSRSSAGQPKGSLVRWTSDVVLCMPTQAAKFHGTLMVGKSQQCTCLAATASPTSHIYAVWHGRQTTAATMRTTLLCVRMSSICAALLVGCIRRLELQLHIYVALALNATCRSRCITPPHTCMRGGVIVSGATSQLWRPGIEVALY